jgi:hypothetical protein
MRMTRAIEFLSGTVAAVLALGGTPAVATPALASTAGPEGPGRAAATAPGTGASTIAPILRGGDIVTGVRGSGGGRVVLTGSVISGGSTRPFLWRGQLSRAAGAAVTALRPAFRGVTSATFYGPDTHLFNPLAIRRGDVRAVGSYVSSAAPRGVHDQGMIYTGPVGGRGGHWTSITVPADGRRVTGHVRACPPRRRACRVMDTIPHSTMGDLVVGNYDLNPGRGDVISGNAFIYNLTTRRWTLLRMHGSLSTKTTLYGVWQDGGPGSPRYTLAGGSSARGGQRGFLIGYNAQTGAFGQPAFFSASSSRPAVTHFEGITGVPGGFHLVGLASGTGPFLAAIPVLRHGRFGRPRWYPVPVAGSPLCPCQLVTGNTVWRNRIMGLYVPGSSPAPHTYLAGVSVG